MRFAFFNKRMIFVSYLCAMDLLTAIREFRLIIFFYGFIVLVLGLLYRRYHQRPHLQDDPNDHADSDLIPVEYRGEYMTMTYWEYLNHWRYFNREQKNAIYNNQMRRLKDGSVRRKFINEKEIGRAHV